MAIGTLVFNEQIGMRVFFVAQNVVSSITGEFTKAAKVTLV
jgi:hypothetical protein